jgi:hypothetical protein
MPTTPRRDTCILPWVRDEELLDRLARAAFGYFLDYTNPENGLVADTSRPGAPASIAVVGFALSAYPIAVERGWLSRDDAAARTLQSLSFFVNSAQGAEPDSSGYRGFYYHFLELQTGRRTWQSELSPIDSSLLVAGMLTAASYFDADTRIDTEIRGLTQEIYRRMDWDWARDGKHTVSQGWKPEHGFLNYRWQGYNEAALLYVLGLGSPTHPLPVESYADWTATYQWEHIYGQDLLYAGPLFIHQFSHAWIDFRGIRDAFMREKHSDYFENSRRAVLVQREYARLNPHRYAGYASDCWGLSAGDGPGLHRAAPPGVVGKKPRRFFEYSARGAPYGPDDGTIAPGAALACLPFAPELVLQAVRGFLEAYPEWRESFMLPSGFNRNAPGADARGWISEGYFGLDQGVTLLMIENHRSGLPWKLMRNCEPIRLGLTRAGFQGGWL